MDDLRIPGGEAKVGGIEEVVFYKFCGASGFPNPKGSGEMLCSDSRMAEAWTVYLIYGDKREGLPFMERLHPMVRG